MTSCIISWNKPNRPDGYARIFRDGKSQLHHKRVLEQKLGRPLLLGMFALHTPMDGGHPKRCIRPDHLYEGSHQQNMLDSVSDGVHPQASKTHCSNGHEFTVENTGSRKSGPQDLSGNARYCRQCLRESAALKRAMRSELGLRASPVLSHCKRGHEYSEENAYWTKGGDRQCRKCTILRQRARRARE